MNSCDEDMQLCRTGAERGIKAESSFQAAHSCTTS